MKRENSGCWSGCLGLVIGAFLGIAMTLGGLFVWAVLQPVDRAPLTSYLSPEDLDVEMTISEAYLNRAVAQNLAEDRDGEPVAVILDFHRAERVEAILEGFVRILDLDALSPALDAELSLGVDDGSLVVHIEEVGVGAVQIARDSLPDFAQPAFESVEEAIEQALNEQLLAAGYQVMALETDEISLTLGFQRR